MTTDPLTTTPLGPDLVLGALELERTGRGLLPHRLPARAREQSSDEQLLMAESQPSGVRVRFRTAARTVELQTIPTKRVYVGLPPRPDGVYDLVVDGTLLARGSVPGGRTLSIDMTTGTREHTDGPAGTVRFEDLPAGDKVVEVWLPHDETTELVALRTDAPVRPEPDPRPVWLHHGSSISHGSDAASPSTTWPALAAAAAGVQLVNLGLGGSALLDPFTARAVRDAPADLISLKLGINLVNADLMRRRALAPAVHGFLDTVREGHPDTPLAVVTALWCPVHEDTPGPAAPRVGEDQTVRFVATGDPAEVAAGRLTLRVVREVLAEVVTARAGADPHLHLVDGLGLYGPADHDELPLPDGLHPDAATHRRIGARFASTVLGPGGALARHR